MTRLVSKIYRLGPSGRDDEGTFTRIWRMCRKSWVDFGTIVVKPAELPPELRAAMTQWANDQYGERRNGGR
jgi:hypothetical protein